MYSNYYQNYPNYQQNVQQPMQQPVQQNYQSAMVQPPILVWVTNEDDAIKFPLNINQSIFMMNQNEPYLYMKSVDQLGKTTFIKKRLRKEWRRYRSSLPKEKHQMMIEVQDESIFQCYASHESNVKYA